MIVYFFTLENQSVEKNNMLQISYLQCRQTINVKFSLLKKDDANKMSVHLTTCILHTEKHLFISAHISVNGWQKLD